MKGRPGLVCVCVCVWVDVQQAVVHLLLKSLQLHLHVLQFLPGVQQLLALLLPEEKTTKKKRKERQ